MSKMKFLTTLGVSLMAIGANATSVVMEQPAEPSMFDGPNFALAMVAIILLVAIMTVAGILKKLTSNPEYFIKLKELKKNADKSNKVIGLFILFTAGSTSAFAQDAAPAVETAMFPEWVRDPNTILLLILCILLFGAFTYVTRILLKTIAMLMPEEEKLAEEEEESIETKFMHALTDAIPLDREHEVMLDHEYDGIRELDNNLPPWWVYMFYATIVFSVVYLVYYHVLPYGLSQSEEYIAEVQIAEEEKAAFLAMSKDRVDENTVELLTAESDLKIGKGIFTKNCQACHAADGGGGTGPNLTDEYWLHGGGINNVFSTIKYGVPSKGMISWESQLRPAEMAQVASYIISLGGTTPASPKDPQGEIWVAPVEEVPADGAEGEMDGEDDAVPEDTEVTEEVS